MPTDHATGSGAHPLLLEARGLTCCRGNRTLFADLDLSLAAGEMLEVHGPNGSGKTTLLRVLCTLTAPESGEIRWRGRALPGQRESFLAALRYVGHQDGIKPALSVRENLEAAARLAGGRAGDGQAALRRFGLAALADTPARALSAGQRRRAALARLLLCKAALWVLDEPFTALDEEGAALMQDLLARQVAGGGAVLLSTHRRLPPGGSPHRRLELGR